MSSGGGSAAASTSTSSTSTSSSTLSKSSSSSHTSEQFLDLSQRGLGPALSGSVVRQISAATRLRRLWLSENALERVSLVHECGVATSLEELYLHSNGLRALDAAHDDCVADWSHLSRLRVLWLGSNRLRALPGVLPDSIVDLRLAANRFDALPPALLRLTRLVHLDLADNAVTALPDEFAALSLLTSLSLADNGLQVLPDFVCVFTRLVELDLAANRLVDLPRSLGDLPHLAALSLHHNRLVPAACAAIDWHSLTALRRLDLSDNHLTRIPDGVFALTALAELSVANNALFAMPPRLVQLTALTALDTHGNQFLNVTDALLEKRGKALAKHFAPPPPVPRRRVRVLLLGDAGVGRSTLADSLVRCNKRARASLVVDHQSAMLRVLRFDTPNKTTVSLWDFAPHSSYELAHRFFVEPDTVVAVVFDLAQPPRPGSLRHWLGAASHTNTPVLVFGTHSDCLAPAEAAQRLAAVQAELEQRAAHHTAAGSSGLSHVLGDVDARSTESATALFDAIAGVVDECAAAKRLVPPQYARLEQAVRDVASPVLTRLEFARLCAAHDAATEADMSAAAVYLHSVGAIFHKADVRELYDTFLRDPALPLFAVASLVKSAAAAKFVRNGVVKHYDLFLLWQDVPTDLFTPMLALCEHYQLCFRLHDRLDIEESFRDGKSLFPILLPSGERELDVRALMQAPDERRPMFARVFAFRRPPPSDLFANILVRLLRHTNAQWSVRYSKAGVYLALGANEALCHFDSLTLRLVVEVRGVAAVGLLKVMVDVTETCLGDFDIDVHSDAVAVSVPCAHCCQHELLPPRMFDMRDIDGALRAGEIHMPCSATRPEGADMDEAPLWFMPRPAAAAQVQRQRTVLSLSTAFRRPSTEMDALRQGGRLGASDTLSMATRVAISALVPDLALVNVATVRFDALTLGAELGRGLATTVYRATLRGETVAVKQFNIGDAAGGRDAQLREFRRECGLLHVLQHPKLIQLLGVCHTPPCLVVCFADRGDLYSFLADAGNEVHQRLALELAVDVCEALAFLHGQTPPMIHRDLKSPNVLLRTGASRIEARVGDLGVSSPLNWGGALKRRHVDNPRWLANEVLDETIGYTLASDIYALGMLVWELFTRQQPFSEYTFRFDSQLEDRIVKGVRPTIPLSTPDGVRDLIAALWAPVARSRPSAAVALERLVKLRDACPTDDPVVTRAANLTIPLSLARSLMPRLALAKLTTSSSASESTESSPRAPHAGGGSTSQSSTHRRHNKNKLKKHSHSSSHRDSSGRRKAKSEKEKDAD